MFVRRTRTRSGPDDTAYHTFRLVRSERDGAKVRQRTLLNLGRHFDIPKERWPLLCRRVEEILAAQDSLLRCPEDVEREAGRLAERLLALGAAAPASGTGDDLQTIRVSTLRQSRPRRVGVEQVGLWALEQAGLPALLAGLGVGRSLRHAALALILARLARPASERATHAWLRATSGAGELLGTDFESVSLMQLYRASDALMKHRKSLETHLFERSMNLFGLRPTVTLYDLTNTYFEGEARGQPKARHGHSKEKRGDCPLLTLGLVLDASGFVRRSQVFAGNVAEATTLEEMLQGLDAPPGALVVMDRGIATEERLQWLRGQGYAYLAVSRERKRVFEEEGAVTVESRSGQPVRLSRTVDEESGEVRLHCSSAARAEKERGIAERFARQFEEGLQAISDGLKKPKTWKKLERVWQRIGRLKQKCKGAGRHYEIDVVADGEGVNATAVKWERKPAEGSMATHPGVYCLRASETDWDEETLWRTYTTLTDLEAVFRSLKSELGLRPVYHSKPERAEGHLFLTVIAYQLVQIVRRRLRERGGPCGSWATLRAVLETQVRSTVRFRREDGRALHVRGATEPEAGQRAIYDALGIAPDRLGVRRTVV